MLLKKKKEKGGRPATPSTPPHYLALFPSSGMKVELVV